ALLELSAEELEECIVSAAESNPALKVVRRLDGPAPYASLHSQDCAEDDEESEPWWNRLAAPITGREEIVMQFRAAAPKRLHSIGEAIISALDEGGYFRGDIEDISAACGAEPDEAEEALHILQRLDPPGLGARSLSECLLAQLDVWCLDPPPRTREFIACCLEGGPRQMMRSAQRLGFTRSQVEAILSFIRENLHPYPARLIEEPANSAQSLPAAACPDVVISREDGRFVVSVPVSERVEVRLDAIYERIAEQLRYKRYLAEHEERVRQNVRAARELIALLQRRSETIAAVAEAIIQLQADYFITQDPETLRPLDQKDVARITGLHESTVCRAVKGKHMLLPDGTLVPIDIFFDDAAPARAALLRVIRREPPEAPYSDKRLAEILSQMGYPIARRTVTKYRAQLGIPPAHKRRGGQHQRGYRRPKRRVAAA
ncbi:MAG: hypothetical protein H5T86_06395, partial [Armatimonadetes bacterium]|nr:hypothetical protein [Armatimonadota bacterium]